NIDAPGRARKNLRFRSASAADDALAPPPRIQRLRRRAESAVDTQRALLAGPPPAASAPERRGGSTGCNRGGRAAFDMVRAPGGGAPETARRPGAGHALQRGRGLDRDLA